MGLTTTHADLHALPITPDLLRKIHHTWSQRNIDYDISLLWTAFCLSSFGFLRWGEFTSTAVDSTSPDRLSPTDTEVHSNINPVWHYYELT